MYLIKLLAVAERFSEIELDNSNGTFTAPELLNENLPGLFGLVIKWHFYIAIGISLIFIIISGIKMTTSSGDPQKFSEGINAFKSTLIGVAVVLGFLVIINLFLGLVGFNELL